MGPKWIGLGDAEQAHRDAPASYSIPRFEQRNSLRVGDLVKLVFLGDRPSDQGHTGERMWVQVVEIVPNGYVGALDNQPRFLVDLKPGARISFGAHHVIALHEARSGLRVPYGLSASVTSDILRGAWPAEAERIAPDQPDSSGWIISSGTAPSSERVLVLVDDLLERFRVLDSILDEPVGTRWVWDADRLEYIQKGPHGRG
jgi:hypothetical protein